MHKAVFALVLLFCVFRSTESADCREGWTYYGENCYLLLRDIMTWYEAREACEAVHGKMAEIQSAEQNTFVTNMLKNQRVLFAWLGLEDLAVEGKFVWTSNDSAPTFRNFYPGQPNDGAGSEDCVSIRSSGHWFDDHCHTSLHPVVCQVGISSGGSEGEVIG